MPAVSYKVALLLIYFFSSLDCFFLFSLLRIWSATYLDNVYRCAALYGCLWTILFQAEECRYYDPYLAEEKNEALKCEWLAITRKSMSRTGTRKSFLSPNVVLLNLHAFQETTQTCSPTVHRYTGILIGGDKKQVRRIMAWRMSESKLSGSGVKVRMTEAHTVWPLKYWTMPEA